jgi:hypothetical protein
VPWSGLDRPGATRVIREASGPFTHVVDIGDGLIACDSGRPRYDVVAVDVFTCEERWRFARTTAERLVIAGVAGEHLILLADPRGEVADLVRLDRRTGEQVRVDSIPLAPDLDAWPPGSWDVTIELRADAPTVMTGAVVSEDALARRFQIQGDGVTAGPGPFFTRYGLAPIDAGIVVQQPGRVVGFDGARELWTVPDFELLDAGAAVLVRKGHDFRLLAAATGEVVTQRSSSELDGHWFGGAASGACFVLARQEAGTPPTMDLVLVGLDRRTLEVRWRMRAFGYCGVASTANLTFVVTHPRTEGAFGLIRALDAGSGEERWRIEIPHAIRPGNVALYGGHLVVPGQGREPLVVVAPGV